MAAFRSKVALTDLASTLRSASLAQLHVQALDGVGCVNHAPDVRREDEERRDVLPGPLPGGGDHWVLWPPMARRQTAVAPTRRPAPAAA